MAVGNVLSKEEVGYRVNEILDIGQSLIVSLQVISPPHYVIKITVPKEDYLTGSGYEFVTDYIDEVEIEKYEGELDESLYKSVNPNFDGRVGYRYYFDSTNWVVFKATHEFFWSNTQEEWILKVGTNGYSSLDEIYDLSYLGADVIEKAEELRRLGDPAYSSRDLSKAVYYIDSFSGEIFFVYDESSWKVSFDMTDWDDVYSISIGESNFVRSLEDSEIRFIEELVSKDFKSGMNILNQRSVYARLDSLF